MENIQIIIYSIIQGITEFLPVSSSAHLYLIQNAFNWDDNLLLFALGAHLGTFLAVIFYNRKLFKSNTKNRPFIFAIISSIPVIFIGGIIGIYGYDYYKSNLFIIALACILGGILLDLSDNYKSEKKHRNKIKLVDCLVIGLFQTLALIPGMSRSGSVITAMRFLGITRKLSLKYSLLTGIPVLFSASIFGLYKLTFLNYLDTLKFVIIIIISFTTALITINFFFRWIQAFSFRIFSIYRVLLGILILIYLS